MFELDFVAGLETGLMKIEVFCEILLVSVVA